MGGVNIDNETTPSGPCPARSLKQLGGNIQRERTAKATTQQQAAGVSRQEKKAPSNNQNPKNNIKK
jgi:hypothetical protein